MTPPWCPVNKSAAAKWAGGGGESAGRAPRQRVSTRSPPLPPTLLPDVGSVQLLEWEALIAVTCGPNLK